MDVGTVILAILGSTAAAALINQIGESLRLKRSHKREDQRSENKDITLLKEALKWVLYDRIRFLAQAYIAAGEVDFDDRRILNEMHKCYHFDLNGNGDLDGLMRAVNDLPLKIK